MITVSADIETSGTQSNYELGTKTVAHVVTDIEKTTETYAELFGIEPPGVRLGVSPKYMGKPTEGKAKMAFIKLENITLEFFEPVNKKKEHEGPDDGHKDRINEGSLKTSSHDLLMFAEFSQPLQHHVERS